MSPVSKEKKKYRGNPVERVALSIAAWSGGSWGFTLAVAAVLLWAISGPLLGFSEAWQLTINTFTAIVTFLMVFLIQRSQNKDTQAMELKLNELVAALDGASNRLISVEDLSEHELQVLRGHYQHLAHLAAASSKITKSHSIDEAVSRHDRKKPRRGRALNRSGSRRPNGSPAARSR